jgi:hypothetical protein
MKKKENFWNLLKRLDEQAGEFNQHVNEANRYFDMAAKKTKMILTKHEKDIHSTIAEVKKALKKFTKTAPAGRKKKSSGK